MIANGTLLRRRVRGGRGDDAMESVNAVRIKQGSRMQIAEGGKEEKKRREIERE
jgi:hypothetical protein